MFRYLLARGRDRGLLGGQGAFHGVELGLIFDTHTNMSDDERAFGRELRRVWAAFARDGVPPEDLAWPGYDESEPRRVLDDEHTTDARFREDACACWESRLPLR